MTRSLEAPELTLEAGLLSDAGRPLYRRRARYALIRTCWLPLLRCLICAVLAIGVAGCSGEEGSLVAAKEYLDRDDYAAAEIELRNVLSTEPQSPPGRYLLAKLLLARGDLANAEAELERAAKFGHPEEQVVPVMAELLIEQKQPAKVIERYRNLQLDDPASAAQLYVQLARAYRATGDLAQSASLLAEALQRVPDFGPALVARARIAGAEGEVQTAEAIARDLTSKQADYPAAWVLLGDVLARSPGDGKEAVQAYRKALELRPRLVSAHSGLITQYQRLGDKEAMQAQIAAMSKVLPRNPTTLFYEAVSAYDQGDFAKARERLQYLLSRAGDQPALLLLAGLTESRLNAFAFAENLLTKAVAQAPEASGPRRALVDLYIRMGETDRALSQIKLLQAANPNDASTFALLGALHVRNGDFRAADAAFVQAAKLNPKDARIRSAMGRTMIARGLVEPGLRELQAAAQLDTVGVDHEIALVTFHMQRKEFEAALKVVDEMARKQPDSPMPDHVRGRVLQTSGNIAGATKAYESAVAKDPRHLAAISSLAELDISAGNLDAARRRYEGYLKLEPRSSKAMLALAVILRRSGAPRTDAIEWVNKAIDASPSDPSTWRRAIEFHQRDGNPSAALSLAHKATEAIRDDVDLLRLLASVQLAAGDRQQAIASLKRVVRLQPDSPDAHILLGLTQLSVGNITAAQAAIDAATRLAPESPPVLRAAITFALVGEKDAAKALAIAQRQQKAHPQRALGWQLEGEIEGGQKHWAAAIAAFEKALARESTPVIARQLHYAIVNAGQHIKAAALAERWLTSHPGDVEFFSYLAQLALQQRDFATAGEHLRAALKVQPDDPKLLNNLAITQLALEQPEALKTAQHAVKLAPRHPELLDTLAQALATHSQLEEAIQTQARAVELKPQSSTMRLKLARYYMQANKNEEAKRQLEMLTHSHVPEREREAAQKLLAHLPG